MCQRWPEKCGFGALVRKGTRRSSATQGNCPLARVTRSRESLDLETRKGEMKVWGPHRPNSRMTDRCPSPVPLTHTHKRTSTQMHAHFLPVLRSPLRREPAPLSQLKSQLPNTLSAMKAALVKNMALVSPISSERALLL